MALNTTILPAVFSKTCCRPTVCWAQSWVFVQTGIRWKEMPHFLHYLLTKEEGLRKLFELTNISSFAVHSSR